MASDGRDLPNALVGDLSSLAVGRASYAGRQSGGGRASATVYDVSMRRGTRGRKEGRRSLARPCT